MVRRRVMRANQFAPTWSPCALAAEEEPAVSRLRPAAKKAAPELLYARRNLHLIRRRVSLCLVALGAQLIGLGTTLLSPPTSVYVRNYTHTQTRSAPDNALIHDSRQGGWGINLQLNARHFSPRVLNSIWIFLPRGLLHKEMFKGWVQSFSEVFYLTQPWRIQLLYKRLPLNFSSATSFWG